MSTLSELLAEHIAPLAHTAALRRVGTMAAFEILKDPDSGLRFATDERRAYRAVLEARKRGVIIRPLGDTMVLMPPPAPPEQPMHELVTATAEPVVAATAG